MDKKTPVEKVYEAWTAIADGRIKIAEGSTVSEGSATMSSSDHSKYYDIRWKEDGRLFYSNDNATYWRVCRLPDLGGADDAGPSAIRRSCSRPIRRG